MLCLFLARRHPVFLVGHDISVGVFASIQGEVVLVLLNEEANDRVKPWGLRGPDSVGRPNVVFATSNTRTLPAYSCFAWSFVSRRMTPSWRIQGQTEKPNLLDIEPFASFRVESYLLTV